MSKDFNAVHQGVCVKFGGAEIYRFSSGEHLALLQTHYNP